MSLPPPFLKAKKRFGQNFLVDEYIINSIVNAIAPKEEDFLVEIGPGHGALSKPVLQRVSKLTAIELDRDLIKLLKVDPFLKGLNLIESDALKVDFSSINEGKKIRVFGNLPYNITSPIIFHLLKQKNIADMHFMLQKEVVDRLCSACNCKDYGRLTLMVNFYANVYPVLQVPPSAFIPAPKVNSAVVKIVPKELDENTLRLADTFGKIVTCAFGTRRKNIANSLMDLFSKDQLKEMGFDLNLRAENLTIDDYLKLSLAYEEKF